MQSPGDGCSNRVLLLEQPYQGNTGKAKSPVNITQTLGEVVIRLTGLSQFHLFTAALYCLSRHLRHKWPRPDYPR